MVNMVTMNCYILLVYHINYQYINDINSSSRYIGSAKFRPFLCVSAMWVQHAAGLHAFTAKQQSSSRDENKNGDSTAVLAKLLESVTDWYPISGEFCLHDSTQREPQKTYGCERSCIFNLVEIGLPVVSLPSHIWGGQAEWSTARCRARCGTSSRRRLYRWPGALVTGWPRAGALFTIFLMVIR